MKLQNAVALIWQVISAMKMAADANDVCKLALVVTTLKDVMPNLLLDDDDRTSFSKFLYSVQSEIKMASDIHAICIAAPNHAIPRCLNTGTFVSCGGPPDTQNKCVLCGRRGTL